MRRRWRASPAHWRIGAIIRDLAAPADVDAEAACWHERLASGQGAGVRAAFERWRDADAAHAEAYARVDAAYEAARGLAGESGILALRQETLARLVVARRSRTLRPAVAAGIAALLVASAALMPWRAAEPPAAAPAAAVEPSLYRTGVGERMTVALADGSTVVLNTSSRLRIAFTKHERKLTLEAGQALFEVAKDRSRPFRVTAGDRVVTAVGTAFDVRLGERSVEVKLIEGRVTVAPVKAAAAPTMSLRPNEVLTAAAGAVSVRKAEDVAQLTSWRDGLVVFEDEPLAAAVAEMNRYSTRRILLAGDKVGRLRVSGAFRTGEMRAFVEALELGFDVQVVDSTESRVVLAARN